jgi:hypothetical protein
MNNENTDEALKADESQNDVDSPTTEDGLEFTGGPISEELRAQARPDESEGEEVESESTDDEEAEGTLEEEAEAPERASRKTAQSRIRELNAEKKQAQERADSLAEQVKKLTSYKPTQDFVPQAPENQETELTYEELMRRQDALVQIRLAQQENVHRVQNEAVEAINAYPELNPDSEGFDSELSESISQAVLAKVQADPTSSLRSFVDSLMRPYRRSLEKQEAGQKETITKQVSQQAMRPTSVQQQEKPFAELSIEEMEAKLGSVYR